MSAIHVEPVRSWSDRRSFINLPWKIYRGDPHWIPPLLGNHKELLNYKPSPFFNDAEIETFLARRQGEVVGRIAAVVNRAHNRKHNDQLGFFGFFECENQQSTASALFETATAWLRQRNVTAIRGPMNPSLNHEVALLVDGFDTSPTFMMTHNPAYYQNLVEGHGFKGSQDLFAFRAPIEALDQLEQKFRLIAEGCERRLDVRVRTMDRRRFGQEVRMFLELFNQAYEGTWGFVPISDAETQHMADGLKQLIVPEMTTVAEINGRPIGAVFGLLDYNPRIKSIGGRLFPFGFIRLLWNRRGIKRVRIISANVIQEYQKLGIGMLLLARMYPQLKAWGVNEVEFSWVMESQPLSYQSLLRAGLKVTKTYRIYDMPIVSPTATMPSPEAALAR